MDEYCIAIKLDEPSSVLGFSSTNGGKSAVMVFLAFLSFVLPAVSYSQEVELKTRLNDWSIYCTKDVNRLGLNDCSLVTAAVAADNPDVWIRLGFAYVSGAGDLEMTTKTPKLKFLKKGVSISTNGRQIGRFFIETCAEDSCQTTVVVDSPILFGFGTAEKATFEYQVNDREGVAISLNVDGLFPALSELRKLIGLEPIKMASEWKSSERSLTVQMRTNPYYIGTSSEKEAWGTPITGCKGFSATKEVKVASGRVKDDKELREWASISKQCSEKSVLWILPSKHNKGNGLETALQEESIYAVYDVIKDEVANIVISNPKGRAPLSIPPRKTAQ
jgi:invasion protein IalB